MNVSDLQINIPNMASFSIHNTFLQLFRTIKMIGISFIFWIIPFEAIAAKVADDENRVSVSFISDSEQITGLELFYIGVHMDIKEGWHVYWRNPGDSGFPADIRWDADEKLIPGAIEWPIPSRFDEEGVTTYGYSDDVTLLVPVEVMPGFDASVGKTKLSAQLNWLVCKDFCIPESTTLEFEIDETGKPAGYSTELLHYIEESKNQLPEKSSAWWGNGTITSETVIVKLHPDSENARIPDTGDIYFYPYTKSIIEHTAPQKITLVDDSVIFEIPASRYLQPGVTEIEGVVVAGESWVKNGQLHNLEVRFTIN